MNKKKKREEVAFVFVAFTSMNAASALSPADEQEEGSLQSVKVTGEGVRVRHAKKT
jgi:hypothetical protein